MATITEYSVNDTNVWDTIVRTFSNYDVFYLSSYSKAFMMEDQKNGVPLLLLYENDDERAINVVFKRDIAKDKKLADKIEEKKYYDLISPYGYGGFLGNISDWQKLNDVYSEYCKEKNYICEFVRFELFTDYYKKYDGIVETRSHNVIRSLDLSLDEMWMDFKQKVRKNVKKANSFDLKCIIENNDEHIKDFLRIYYSTMERTDAKDEYFFSEKFFKQINKMNDNLMYFYVLYEGKIISAELVIYGSKNAYSYLGGTDKEYFHMRPNDYLKYEIVKWAKEKGLDNFVLGGGYGADDGIYQYKLSLAPHGQKDFYIGWKVFNQRIYDQLVMLRESDLDKSFFPLYRS